ncbi:hypothetical protein IWW39_003606 [Coemansia spiralis]|uniref:Uncharacterized protein n=1 Tax=Coemansia spiralis TaxID=417178 RepID=A0A9W8L3G9_9FUNG|nr:hypothetical protein IWW39_003606 [Coemansia spiralis]
MEHDSPEDIAKKRLAYLDTDSILNLSFDKSFSPEALKLLSLSTVRLGTFVPNRSMGKRATMHRIQTFSSDSQLLPRIKEVLGSSDSQLKPPTNFSAIHNGPLTALDVKVEVESATTETSDSFSASTSSDGASMTTADMSLPRVNGSCVGQSTASMRAAALDQELQAAVDIMLQGSVPLAAAPDRAYYNESKMLSHTVAPPPHATGTSMPSDSSIYSLGSQSVGSIAPLRKPYYRAIQSTRQLRQRLTHQFARYRGALSKSRRHTGTPPGSDATDSTTSPPPSLLPASDREAAVKRKFDASVDQTCEKRAKTGGETSPQMHFLTAVAPPAPWIPKCLYPVVYYVQLRPFRTLGIVLTVLVILLVLLIVILIVGVFPFLMRSTLQDFSMVVTSLHAIPPPEISRALSIDDRLLSHTRLMAMHGGRIANELDARPDLLLPRLPGEHDGQPVPMSVGGFPGQMQRAQSMHVAQSQPLSPLTSVVPRSSAIQAVPPLPRALVRSSGVPSLASILLSPTSSHHMRHSTGSVFKTTNVDQDAVVTVTAESIHTVHVQRQLTPAASMPTFDVAAITPTLPPLLPASDVKSLDSGSYASSMYMMQLAGNLTSGGPIGVSIEFTEPLRLLWRDTVVGIIHYPETIHVPGRGTTQWKWPLFEISIPSNITGLAADDRILLRKHDSANSEQPEPRVQLGADRIVDSRVGGIAQRRALGAGGAAALGRSVDTGPSTTLPNDLASWFAAIQTHKSFTMHWKSQVKLSAMGIHTSNIKFEKSVRVLCKEDNSCSIIDRAFMF